MSNAFEKFKADAEKMKFGSQENVLWCKVKAVKPNWLKICGFVFILLVFFYFVAPVMWFGFLKHRWESQIKNHQNPAELQAWAASLIAMYGSSNIESATIIIVTNKPPSEIPVTFCGPRIALVSGAWSGQNENYVTLAWGSGSFIPALTMEIGTTNFVYGSKDKWKPGIYFNQSR